MMKVPNSGEQTSKSTEIGLKMDDKHAIAGEAGVNALKTGGIGYD